MSVWLTNEFASSNEHGFSVGLGLVCHVVPFG